MVLWCQSVMLVVLLVVVWRRVVARE